MVDLMMNDMKDQLIKQIDKLRHSSLVTLLSFRVFNMFNFRKNRTKAKESSIESIKKLSRSDILTTVYDDKDFKMPKTPKIKSHAEIPVLSSPQKSNDLP